VPELISYQLPFIPMLFMRVECVRRITWKFTQPKPTALSFGTIIRRRMLSRDNGVPRSEAKTQSVGRVWGDDTCS